MPYPRTYLSNLSSKREFAREVGFSPQFHVPLWRSRKFSLCRSSCQLLAFIFPIFRLALLRDWPCLNPAAGSSFAPFFASLNPCKARDPLYSQFFSCLEPAFCRIRISPRWLACASSGSVRRVVIYTLGMTRCTFTITILVNKTTTLLWNQLFH